LRPASLRQRFSAFLFDYLLILIYIAVLAAVSTLLLFSPWGERRFGLDDSPIVSDALAFLTLVLPVMLYFAISHSRPAGATWGKHRRELQVVRYPDGARLGFGRALLRAAVKLLPWQLAHTALFNIPGWPMSPAEPPGWVVGLFVLVWVLVFIYWVSALLSRDRRALYDRVAGTWVRWEHPER
jgi:uncharacterized RDD family membrane protein YckC